MAGSHHDGVARAAAGHGRERSPRARRHADRGRRDASARLAAELAGADVIAAEDTRRTRRLAAALGVTLGGRVVSYYDADERARLPELLERARGGRTRRARHRRGDAERVRPRATGWWPPPSTPASPSRPCPGRRAVLTALALSGLPVDRFCFEGFLPRKAGERARALAALAAEPRTLVFFEAPHRLAETLTAMADAFGADRPAAVCRELTKTYEEVRRGPLGELAAWAARRRPRRGHGRRPAVLRAARCDPRWPAARPEADPRKAAIAAVAACVRASDRERRLRRRRRGAQGARTADRRPAAPVGLARARAQQGVLRHDADLLRQRRPAHRARLHDGRRRRAHPLAPPARRGRLVPHRHRRARPEGAAHRRGERRRPRRSGPTSSSRTPGSRCWRPSTRQRRLHPDHRAAAHASGSRSSCRRCTTRARSTRAATRAPTAWRCEEFKLPGELLDGEDGTPAAALPDPRPPGRDGQRDELLLPALGVRRPAARATTRRTRTFVQPESRPQRGRRRSSGRGCRTCRSSRSTFDWGIPVPVGRRRTSSTCGSTRCSTTPPRSGSAATEAGAEQFARTWPADVHLVGKDILRFHAVIWPAMLMAAGLPLPQQGLRPRLAARRRREDEQVQADRRSPRARSSTHFGSDAFRYYFLRAIPFGHDGSFSWEDMSARYTAELAERLGNLASRRRPRWSAGTATACCRRRRVRRGRPSSSPALLARPSRHGRRGDRAARLPGGDRRDRWTSSTRSTAT